MHKQGDDTFGRRLKLLVRGMLFYNTIYWKRASDVLDPPKLRPEERQGYAPQRDPDVVRPRENPRARLQDLERRRVSAEIARLRVEVPPAVPAKPDVPAVSVASVPEVNPGKAAPAMKKKWRSSSSSARAMKRLRKRRSPKYWEERPTARSFLARILQRWIR